MDSGMGRRRVVIGVAGGIASFKACKLVRELAEQGHEVHVVATANALKFVGAPTWEALSGRPVRTSVWESVHEVTHVALGQTADLVVVAPATANLLARAAHGLADDLLTNVLLTARRPVVYAAGMHTEMWRNPATVRNVEILRGQGAIVVDPVHGRLTGRDTGIGRMAEPLDLLALCRALLYGLDRPGGSDLTGSRVLVCAGATHERVDDDRWLIRRTPPERGLAIAAVAVALGAEVTLIAANIDRPIPAGVSTRPVTTPDELLAELEKNAPSSDVIVLAAGVANQAVPPDTVKPHQTLVRCDPERVEARAHEARAHEILVHGAARPADPAGSTTTVTIHGPRRPPLLVPAGPEETVAGALWDTVIGTRR
jgi:phosphopantothenoylcysteine decarboxylase/phosphopantothenate--cysteine ligase